MTLKRNKIGELEWVTAQLRHAYVQLVRGNVTKPKEFAEGLIAPQIARLERIIKEQKQEGPAV